MSLDSLAVRALCGACSPRLADHFALRALLRAHNLLSLALGRRLGELRYSDAPDARRFAELQERSFQLPIALSAARILGERWAKVPERRRPHYLPEQRYEILRVKASLLLSAKETAHLFAISEGTVHRWEGDLREARCSNPDACRIGEKLQPTPPVRRYADAVRELVGTLSIHGFGGAERIAQVLARLGYAISARTVGRIRKEPLVPGAPAPLRAKTTPAPVTPPESPRELTARGPLEKVHIDITQVKSLFGLVRFRIAVVLDVFSRFPLAFSVFVSEPTGADIVALLERALAFGKPRVLITDKGSAFRSQIFAAALATLGIEHRFGALYRHGSIARLERLWRSLKKTLGVHALVRRLVKGDLERDVRLSLLHYAFFQPHSALRGATPAEVCLRLPPAAESAVQPPRGKAGEIVAFPQFVVERLGPNLPVVRRKAA